MSAPSTPLAAIRARRLGDFSDEALLWLALPPVWTLPLAAWCEFPAGKQPLPSLFENAVRTGLALSDGPTPKSPDLSGYDPALLADLGLAPLDPHPGRSFGRTGRAAQVRGPDRRTHPALP